MDEKSEEWTWQRAAPNVVLSALTATTETCSQPSTILSRNMGFSDSRCSHYLRKSKTERENNSHGVQLEQGDRREGLEEVSRTHSTHRNSATAFVTGILLISSCSPCLLLQITNPTSTTTKGVIMGMSPKYCKDKTIPNSQCTLTACWQVYLLQAWLCTSSHPARGWSNTASGTINTLQINHGGRCWARFSNAGSIVSFAKPMQWTTAYFPLRHINSWPHRRSDLRHLLLTFFGGRGCWVSMKATYSKVLEQPKLKFNLVGQTDLLISTVLVARRQQPIKYKCGHWNFSEIHILAMQIYVPFIKAHALSREE